MNRLLLPGCMLILALLTLSCSGHSNSPYNDPDAQRERAKEAQDELRRDTR